MTNTITDLILLVGTNPLPNLVVAKYFINTEDKLNKIWLIYSKETSDFKNNLIEAIKRTLIIKYINKIVDFFKTNDIYLDLRYEFSKKSFYEIKSFILDKINSESFKDYTSNLTQFKTKIDKIDTFFENIELTNERNHKDIVLDLNKQLINKITNKEKQEKFFHLNYTGGTKSMVVHVYRTLEKDFNNITFSYLNAKDFTLNYDDDNNELKDIRKEIKVTFEEMIKLHNYEQSTSEKLDLDYFKDTLDIFEDILEREDILTTYFSKQNGYDRKIFEKDNGDLEKKIKKLFEIKITPNEYYSKVITSLPEEYKLFDDCFKINKQFDEKNLPFTIRFLDGKWLEYYVYRALKELFKDDYEFLLSSEVKDKKQDKKFEIDMCLIKGYQLYGISCTTDYKYHAKAKGFEVIQRTKQIGGDEAKAILITTMIETKRAKLEEDLSMDTGTGKKPFLILGKEDLKKEILQDKILRFIEEEE